MFERTISNLTGEPLNELFGIDKNLDEDIDKLLEDLEIFNEHQFNLDLKIKYLSGKGCSDKTIQNAESKLGLKFSKEYKSYLRKFGFVSFNSHELTGLSDEKELGHIDVVLATLQERKLNGSLPKNYYVIENLQIEGILIISDFKGYIYEYRSENNNIRKIYPNLISYITSMVIGKE